MVICLAAYGYAVDRKRLRRLMQRMGLEAIYPKPHLSQAGAPSVRYPYLLRGGSIERIDQVGSSDMTYIRLARGFVYLVAIIDWFSRFVLAWELSTTLAGYFFLPGSP
jgi:putative transposase